MNKGLNSLYGDESGEAAGVNRKKEPCVFVSNPFPECYCTKMDSRNTASAVYYCGEHFEECEIFMKHGTGEKNNYVANGLSDKEDVQ